MKSLSLKDFVIRVLRRGSYKWRPRNEAIYKARVCRKQVNGKGREVWHYNCAHCPKDKLYTRKQVQADHIVPIVDPEKGFTNWDDYINRLYIGIQGFQILCIDCHKQKTSDEKVTRNLSKMTPEKAKKFLEVVQKKSKKKRKKK